MKHFIVSGWMCVVLASGAEAAEKRLTLEGVTRSHFNTPLRVLLDKQPFAEVTSSLDGIYVNEGEGWKRFAKTIRIETRKNKGSKARLPFLVVNGTPSKASHIYLRAGSRPSERLRYDGKEFQGAIKINLWRDRLVITNLLPVEDYLAGTLASEMNASWEMEALKAQAVASCSYALYMMLHPKSTLYDLERSIQDQVYSGAGAHNARVTKAIQATRGEYLSTEDRPIKAYFHARCGGRTETASTVWSFASNDIKKGVPCPYCEKFPSSWKTALTTESLRHAFALSGSPSSDLSLKIVHRTPSGRIQSLRIASGNSARTVTADDFRAILGYTRIKSANFRWQVEGAHLQIEGIGSGHGVGMCQWGARHLAKVGKTYREILAHYYPLARLSNPLGNPIPLSPRLAAQLPTPTNPAIP